MKKVIAVCLAAMMLFSIAVILSGCGEKDVNRGVVLEEESVQEDVSASDAEDSDGTTQSIKDSMNKVLEESDAGLTEEEKKMVGELFDALS